MSKYCIECFKQVNGSLPTNIVLSQEPETCDKCGKEEQLILNASAPALTEAECQVETQKHIEAVRKYLRFMVDKIEMRGVKHDASKLESPEVEVFAEYTPKLNNTTFGSEEYYANLEGMKSALDHHYASNRHHPEHFVNGINDMTLVDIGVAHYMDRRTVVRHMNDFILPELERMLERIKAGA